MPVRHFPAKLFIFLIVLVAGWPHIAAARAPAPAYAELPESQRRMLDDLEKRTFDFFRDAVNPGNGLVPDHWPHDKGDYFASIASVGFALTAYGIGAQRGWMSRSQAARLTLTTLKFFSDARQDANADATGYRGFFYHFLDMESGRRYHVERWVELSTVDTALLLSGVLFSQSFYDRDTPIERQIRELADRIYRRVDWQWASPRPPLVAMGWTPEAGFNRADWKGYNEAMVLYVLALGSPTHPVDKSAWGAWTQTYDNTWGSFQGQEYLGFAPLFGYQYSQAWIDFRDIQDEYMRRRKLDYFENSRRATFAQREYAIHNPMHWRDYGSNVWGLTACNGPRAQLKPGETDRYVSDPKTFYGYIARGAGIRGTLDDGTIAPTAASSSIAFAPNIVIPAIQSMIERYGDNLYTRYGFVDAFNPSFTFSDRPLRSGHVIPAKGWFDTIYLGIDQGPIILMLENYRSGLVWKVMRKNPYIRKGLERAGFTGGWLEAAKGQ